MKEEKKQKYHVLARGLILSKEREYILVANCIGMDNTFLPGGHVEFGEGMHATLAREIEEELGLMSEVKEYIGAVEAGFVHEKIYHQEINHIFETEIEGLSQGQNPVSKESHLKFYWIHIEELEKRNLQPALARKLIKDYINRESGPYFTSTFGDN